MGGVGLLDDPLQEVAQPLLLTGADRGHADRPLADADLAPLARTEQARGSLGGLSPALGPFTGQRDLELCIADLGQDQSTAGAAMPAVISVWSVFRQWGRD